MVDRKMKDAVAKVHYIRLAAVMENNQGEAEWG